MSLHAREDGLQDREFRSHAWEAGLHLLGGEFARFGGRLARAGAGMDENQSFLKSRWKKFFFFGALALMWPILGNEYFPKTIFFEASRCDA